MKSLIFKTLILSLSFFSIKNTQSQNLKIIQISDSSLLTKSLIQFDSIWNQCMIGYGVTDISKNFVDVHKHPKKPITALNFVDGLDGYYNQAFNYKLDRAIRIDSNQTLYQLNLDWMQLAIIHDVTTNKIGQICDFNYLNLYKTTYKNLTVYTETPTVDTNQLKQAYDLTIKALNEFVDTNYFNNKKITIYSSTTIKGAERMIGFLAPSTYFSPNSTFGGMSDPFNDVIISGVLAPIHLHELIHLANPLNVQCGQFISEGIATYYGGTGNKTYTDDLKKVIEILKSNHIESFEQLFKSKISDEYVNIRGNYILSAHMLHQIKTQFGLKVYQNFLYKCNSSNMEELLKEIYQVQDNKELFRKIYSLSKL